MAGRKLGAALITANISKVKRAEYNTIIKQQIQMLYLEQVTLIIMTQNNGLNCYIYSTSWSTSRQRLATTGPWSTAGGGAKGQGQWPSS